MRTLKQGIYSAQEVPSSRYHADELCAEPTLSSGLAKVVLNGNMEHARLAHPRLNKHYSPSSEAKFSAGTAAHDLILEGGTGRICVVDPELYRSEPTKANPTGNAATGWNNKSIKEFRDICIAEGKTPILKSDYADVERMACAVHQAVAEEPDLCGVRLNEEFGLPEQTIIWQEDNGVWCRARADFLTHDYSICLDLKTTAARSPQHFERGFITQMGYDLSQEFYRRGIEKVTGVRPEWIWPVSQDFYPFSVFFCKPSQSMQEVARVKVDAAIAQWGACLKSGKWPSWPRGIRSVEATPWAIAEAEETAAAGEQWDKDAPGAEAAFMCGSVHDEKTKAGSLADFDAVS